MRGCICEWELPPPSVRCRWLAGAPKAQHSALPSQGQIQLQGMAAMGPVSSSCFGRTARGGSRGTAAYKEGKLKKE